jgi:hypothetical protein
MVHSPAGAPRARTMGKKTCTYARTSPDTRTVRACMVPAQLPSAHRAATPSIFMSLSTIFRKKELVDDQSTTTTLPTS